MSKKKVLPLLAASLLATQSAILLAGEPVSCQSVRLAEVGWADISATTGLATTVGYGPRYLHSTGQLHKGGPPTPILIILASEDTEDLPIPGERHGFATLKLAQALGDLATLRAAHRRALWVPVRGSVVEAVERLSAALAPNLRRHL